MKSGASKDTSQEAFDNGVFYDKPPYATLRWKRIKITSVAYEHVEHPTLIIMKTNGSVSSVLKDTFRPLPDQVRRCLGLLDNDDHFAWLIFSALIDDETWRSGPQSVIDEYGNCYLQAGGTAEKMSVELRRREDDGEYRFYIVGRDHDLAEPLTETIAVQAAHEPRHPQSSSRPTRQRRSSCTTSNIRRSPTATRSVSSPTCEVRRRRRVSVTLLRTGGAVPAGTEPPG